MDLKECRREIDRIDRELVRLLTERMDVCREVAAYKQAVGMPVYDPIREKEKLDGLAALAGDDRYAEALQDLFSQIMACSRAWQEQLMGDGSQEAQER